jgi:hypothetical protein
MRKFMLFMVVWCFVALPSFAQTQKTNQEAFAPISLAPGDNLRTGGGAPGVAYWQNSADYKIKASFDPATHKVTASSTMTYTNNSPDALDFLWLQVEQNLFTNTSRGYWKNPPNSRWRGAFEDGGDKIAKVTVIYKGKRYTPKYDVDDTQMRLDLAEALGPKGSLANGNQVQVEFEWSFVVPSYGADRLGRYETPDGIIYEVAQWYPRVYVYDHINGWNSMPYIGQGEFYLEYGNYDFEISAPRNMVVVATGTLLNPQEVFTAEQARRFAQAKTSESTVMIIKPEEVGTAASRPAGTGNLTWKYKAQNVRDAVWAVSKAFVLDGAMWDDDKGDPVLLMSAYPKKSIGTKTNPGWEQSTQMLRHTVKTYSNMWLRYPYPVMINVAGVVGGMEYPMMVFCGADARGDGLFGVTDHEFGHSWFPMIVGSDERRYAWMDEGFNTFINFYSDNLYNNAKASDVWKQNAKQMAQISAAPIWDQPIMTQPDLLRANGLGVMAYMKPGYGLVMLREYILGQATFDKAFQTYINRWKFKHPQPQDFFRTMEELSGEELSWFWRGWFYGTGKFDQGIKEVSQSAGQLSITLENKEAVILPSTIELTFEDGTTERMRFPVEAWQMGNTFKTAMPATKTVTKITLDPDQWLPDVSRANDVWTRPN